MTAKPVAAALVTSEDKRYGVRKQWPLSGAEVELSYLAPDRSSRWIDRRITLHAELDDQQRVKLAEIAEKTPVTKAVRAGTEIRTAVVLA